MGKYICKICGKEFDRVGNGVYCGGPHYRPCPVCGEPVAYVRPSDPRVCCSEECTRNMADQSKQHQKICAECGKPFSASQASQIFCKGPHTAVCEVCGKSFTYTVRPTERPHTCSRKCQEGLRSQTAQRLYGVDNVSKLSEVKQKISERNGSEEVRTKRAQTSLKNWGVDNPAKAAAVKQKMTEAMRSEEYLSKRAATCLNRYGVEFPMQIEAIKAKRAATNLSRYGTTGHSHSREDFMKMMVDPSKVDNYLAFKEDPQKFIIDHYTDLPSISTLEADLGVTNTPIYNILIKSGCRELLARSYSSLEDEVYNFIAAHVDPELIIRNDRTVIKPQEVDIYLPSLKLGIECNPVATHNSSFIDPWGGDPKPYKYHQDKSKQAQAVGIQLFHIFGYEWVNKRSIIESMLCNLLGCNEHRVGARETYVVDLLFPECSAFLDANHRQGALSASIRYGLRLKTTDELVAVMTFGKLRNSMGYQTEAENLIELSRFCTKLGYTVIGGASKLFNHFKQTYTDTTVVSFSDFAHTSGKLYQTLGFTQEHLTTPSYVWVDKYDKVYHHRVTCQKQNLPKLFAGEEIDPNATERQIMEAHDFAQVYDSGVYKWRYTSSLQ